MSKGRSRLQPRFEWEREVPLDFRDCDKEIYKRKATRTSIKRERSSIFINIDDEVVIVDEKINDEILEKIVEAKGKGKRQDNPHNYKAYVMKFEASTVRNKIELDDHVPEWDVDVLLELVKLVGVSVMKLQIV
ncbi:hypothetical protein F2Q69_00040411 [Brassica cretica]|uniref:Uncharacterized protein n=1 Tax=Brassica cretica TaxID=69181 RepID=A0A8S9NJQ9_BRACR|nr:hypothetical protein F2Q69_00040411 [Brassica cretica]